MNGGNHFSQVLFNCLDELFQNAEPPTTWDDVNERSKGTDRLVQNDHCIDGNLARSIVSKWALGLPEDERDGLWLHVFLGYGPGIKGEAS